MNFENNQLISITDIAIQELKKLLLDSSSQGSAIKISIDKSTTGYYYGIDIQEEIYEGDREFIFGDLRILINKKDENLLKGTKIEYIEDEAGGGFIIENPHNLELEHTGGCSCCS
ncbi:MULTISPECIES: iron-sulfur cluster assembly accessory protein [unclassified Gemella]|uniref:HesB/IscA family protein n=1 Tax=unclassified Gemella TaxID=2624949 RepID=UPI0015D009D7|nr:MULTISPECIES: iron-sulfur cluster assembly accessory protein [unclassified Gemella]MBF0710225.1 iron-sulfur cluster assembly accessory protein [Gemella sp. GL1.1]NYS27569.1 iron-sulfur cluster assembly accessory protein [Gemella sp. GL1]